jgi:hypothetical protein
MAHMTARATSSDIATKSNPMSGIGGPHTNEERPAAVASEIPQTIRTGGAHRRLQKHVSTTSRLSNPHTIWITVSTFWPTVRERGSWRNPPRSACPASHIRNSTAQARRPRRTTGRILTRSIYALILPWDIVSYVPALAPRILRGIGEAMRCTTPGRLVLVKEQAEFFDIDLSGIQEAEGQGSRLPEMDHFHHPNPASKSSSSMSEKGWVLYRYTRAPNTQYCWSRAFRRCNICLFHPG